MKLMTLKKLLSVRFHLLSVLFFRFGRLFVVENLLIINIVKKARIQKQVCRVQLLFSFFLPLILLCDLDTKMGQWTEEAIYQASHISALDWQIAGSL